MLRKLQGARGTSFTLVVVILALQLLAGKALGQTDPVAQALPYTQSFSTLTGATTTYPAGFQGWSVTGALSTSVLIAPPAANQSLFSGQTNATTTPYVGDMVGKVGIVSGASNVKTLCLALNTTGATGVQVIYTVATQGQTAGGFIDELDLQYRIGTSGNFTTIAGATYQNDALTNTNTAVTTAYNPSTLYVLLPAACNNVADVEIRWIQRNVSGSGVNHPGFSVTNITAQQASATDYYSQSSGNLNNVATWGVNPDGTGAGPTDFITDAQIFHVSNGNPGALSGNWTVSGSNSKIIVDGTDFTNTAAATVTATIDVNAGRTLTLQNPMLPALGILSATSTVIFSNLTGVSVPTVAATAYGNITFSGSTVTIPAAAVTQKVQFAGNFTLQGGSSFIGANFALASGYSLVTTGNNNQVINANGLPLTIWNLDEGSTNAKAGGTLTLAPNTAITTVNSLLMILNGGTPQFVDGGNTITILNNLDCSGNSAAYNFTGTVWMNGAGSGSENIRGGSGLPIVAAVNNLVLNNVGISVKLNPSTGGSTFVVNGNLTVTDTANTALIFQGNTLALGGNFISRNPANLLTMTGAGSMLLFNGATAQSYTSAVPGGNTFSGLKINNSAGLTLNTSMNITGTLTLTNGVISTGVNTVSIGATGSVSGANSGSYVSGNLSKAIGAGSGVSKTYEVGDVTYSPVTLTFPGSISFPGSVLVRSTAGTPPTMSTSYISAANFVNRYWTITNSGLTISSGGVNVALSYNSGDITGGGDNTGFFIRKYTASAWTTAPSVTNTTTAATPLQPYASTTTGVASASFSGNYIAGAADCAASAGTVTATPATVCGSGSTVVSLTGVAANTGNTYQWQSSPDGSSWVSISGATNSTYTTAPVLGNTYYLAIVGCILTGATVNALPAIVSVNPLPSSTGITTSGVICNGGTVALSSNSTNATSWSWIGADGSVSTMQNPVMTPTATTTYSLTLSSPGGGCSSATVYTTTVTVNAPPTSTGITNSGAICNGGTVTLHANSIGATGWSWIGSDGFVSAARNPVATPTATATYSLTISGTGSGCSSVVVYTTSVAVNALPTSTGITNSGAICNGGTVTLSSNSTGATAWSWKGSDGFVSAAQNPAATPTTTVTYSVTLSSTGSGCSPATIYTTSVTVNAAPTSAGITNSGAICNGGTVVLSSNSTGATAWSWIGSDGFVSATQNPIATPTATTTYSLTLSSTGSGCSPVIVYTTSVTVNAIPVSTGITNSGEICNGGTVTLNANSIGATSWSWIGSDGFVSAAQNPIATPTATTTYSLTVSGTGSGCSSVAVYTTSITVNARPTSTGVANSGAICNGGTVALTSNSTGASAWSWIGSDGFVSAAQNPIATPTATTTYSLTLSSTGSGCNPVTVYTTSVTVNAVPTSVGISNSGAICNGGTVTLSANSTGATGWSWIGPDGFISAAQNPIATPTATATYSLTLSSTGSGCSPATIYTTSVTVNAIPTSTGITNSGTICNGGTVTLSSNSTGATAWLWMGSDGFVSAAQNPVATPTATTTYSVTVSSIGTGCSPTTVYTTSVTVNVSPTSTGITNSGVICNGGTVVLSSNSTGATAWSWIGSDGFVSATQNPIATPTATTTYSLTLSSTGSGCSPATIYTISVTVNAIPTSAGITNSGAICNGGTVTLNSNSTGATAWSWIGSDGFISAAQNPVATPTATATYSLTLSSTGTITYTFPSTVTVTAIVTIDPAPSAILGTAIVCRGSMISLSDTTSGGTWSSNNSNATVGSAAGIVTGAIAGTATISYTMPTGCFATSIVTVNSLPLSISGIAHVCQGLATALSDLTPGGTWSTSNGNATIGSTGMATGVTAGVDTIVYTINTGCMNTAIVTVNPLPAAISGPGALCAGSLIILSDEGGGSWSGSNASATVGTAGHIAGINAGSAAITYTLPTGCVITTVVTVNAIVVPAVSIASGAGDTICSGSSVLFTATPTNGGTTPVYQWTVNSVITGATGATYSYTPSNGDVISAAITSNAGCVAPATVSASDTITVLHTDTATISISVSPRDTVCLGSAVLFTAVSANAGPSPAYIWLHNGVEAGTGFTYGFIPANGDNIICELLSNARCRSADSVASNSIMMTVDASYIPSVEIIAMDGLDIHPGESDTFRAVVTNGGPVITYQWARNTTIIAGATSDIYYGSDLANNDSISCVVTSVGPCGYASFNTVTIHVIPTGVQQYATVPNDIKLLPNPNKGQFTIKGTIGEINDEEVYIEVTNMIGQVVYKNKVIAHGGVINEPVLLGSAITNGMYLLNIHAGNERMVLHFVIEQ